MKTKLISISISLVLFFGGFFVWQTIANKDTANCVTVYVDYGVLNNGSKSTECVSVNGKIDAMTALNLAGLSIIGTDKYGLQIACRVNSFPNGSEAIGIKGHEDYVEKCTDMPASFAYWAILIKRKSDVPNPMDVSAKWNWAQTGILDITLNKGDAIGLVFADNENVRFPK